MRYDLLAGNHCIRLTVWDGETLRLILDVSALDDVGPEPDQLGLGLDDRYPPPPRRVGLPVLELEQLKVLHRWIGHQIDAFEQPPLPGLFDGDRRL